MEIIFLNGSLEIGNTTNSAPGQISPQISTTSRPLLLLFHVAQLLLIAADTLLINADVISVYFGEFFRFFLVHSFEETYGASIAFPCPLRCSKFLSLFVTSTFFSPNQNHLLGIRVQVFCSGILLNRRRFGVPRFSPLSIEEMLSDMPLSP